MASQIWYISGAGAYMTKMENQSWIFSGCLLGLLHEYQIEFFSCTNTNQIKEPDDYKLWLQTMGAEFPTRFKRLFCGPMWSNQKREDINIPANARVNVAAVSRTTHWRYDTVESKFTKDTDVQIAALDQLKSSNPKGRFWIKLDATDVKTALMESERNVWNGDEDLGDGKIKQLRESYEERRLDIQDLVNCTTFQQVTEITSRMERHHSDDLHFLGREFKTARDYFEKKFKQGNCPDETLKQANWEVVEVQTLIQQCQDLSAKIHCIMMTSGSSNSMFLIKHSLMKLKTQSLVYLKNLFKKKRMAATHVLVTMISEERRNSKPYALPVRYIACTTLRDQFVRDLNKQLKHEMVKRNMHVVVDQNGMAVVDMPNPDIPVEIIEELHNCRFGPRRMTLEDAITYVRGQLVPAGYTPYPFRRETPESLLDKLRSVIATCVFRAAIEYWKRRGVDFSTYLYIPEVDPVTGQERHDRSDHNHLLKRIASSIRKGKDVAINYEAFDDVLSDQRSGLTHAALIGKRKQSLVDAERLISVHVVNSLRRNGHDNEAKLIEICCNWHEATDGRGLTQLQRCKFNYSMMNFLLDQWMPWHKTCYDFSTIDINRPVDCIRGFSRETLVEVTTNIESQELRRRQNNIVGYPEHPRAGGTDDLETFFSIVHRSLGNTFTLKSFKEKWPQLVREFSKRMDINLPFYYWTLNERFRVGDENGPCFDEAPEIEEDVDVRNHPQRLHRLRVNHREDGSIFVPGRAFLPARHKGSIRQRLHRPIIGQPPVPSHMAFN